MAIWGAEFATVLKLHGQRHADRWIQSQGDKSVSDLRLAKKTNL